MNVTKNENLLLPQIKLNMMITELQKGLLNDLFWLLKESNNHDAIINIGEAPNVKSFKAHISILSARSLYFRAILSSGHSNKRNSMIEITQSNIQPDVFEIILKFLYTGKISLKNEKNVKSLFEYIVAAEKLWLYQLIQYIENYLIYQMSDWLKSNFVYVLIKTTSNPSSFRLLHEFVNDMLRNHSYLLFDSDDFDAIPENILVQLLQHRRFKDISEEKIWNTVLNWGIYQHVELIDKDVRDWSPLDFSKLQTSLQRIVPLIRFTHISPKVFYEIIEPYKEILTTGLYQKIMQNPIFYTYNKLMFRPPTLQRRDSFSSIPSPILHAFPMPPSKGRSIHEVILPPKEKSEKSINEILLPSNENSINELKSPSKEESMNELKLCSKEESMNELKLCSKEKSMSELILTASRNQSFPQSTVDPFHKTTESLQSLPCLPSIPNSTSTMKPKNVVKRKGSIKKSDELLAKITSSVLSSTYTVRRKPKSTSYPIETSDKSLLLDEKLKRSNTSSKKSEFSNLESVFELKTLKSFGPETDTSSLTLRKMKRLLNRKTSIVSNSTSSSTMSVSTLSR